MREVEAEHDEADGDEGFQEAGDTQGWDAADEVTRLSPPPRTSSPLWTLLPWVLVALAVAALAVVTVQARSNVEDAEARTRKAIQLSDTYSGKVATLEADKNDALRKAAELGEKNDELMRARDASGQSMQDRSQAMAQLAASRDTLLQNLRSALHTARGGRALTKRLEAILAQADAAATPPAATASAAPASADAAAAAPTKPTGRGKRGHSRHSARAESLP